jgi:hypothetical protein
MKSPIDNQEYIIEIRFDSYKEIPLNIEFIEPNNPSARGTKNAYPLGKGKYGSFFHEKLPSICHPCSRKAYSPDLHHEWELAGWQQNPQIGSLTNLRAILSAIYWRISDEDEYGGRMHG